MATRETTRDEGQDAPDTPEEGPPLKLPSCTDLTGLNALTAWAYAAVATMRATLLQINKRTQADADLRAQVADIVAAGLDATAPPSKRRLGRREARRQIRDAARKVRAILGSDPAPHS